jgi:hypothetical protein
MKTNKNDNINRIREKKEENKNTKGKKRKTADGVEGEPDKEDFRKRRK